MEWPNQACCAATEPDPLRLAVTASTLDKESLTAADVVVVDASGQAVPDSAGMPATKLGLKPSAEAALHAPVAHRTGAGAVVHVYTVASVVAGRR